MKTYTLFLAIACILFFANCESSKGDANSQNQGQTENAETTEQQTAEVLKDAAVWTLKAEVEDEVREGTITFFESDKVKVKDGVADATYTYKYIDSGAAVELKNVAKADDILYFMLSDATDTYEVWESVDADKQSVWTLTKK